MTKIHLILPDSHSHPDYSNERYDWIGKLILDLKPDVLVNIGDTADMPSLSAYDKGKASFHGRNYEKDINAHLDAQERMWGPITKAKKKKPYSIILEGNHEHRIKRFWTTNLTLKAFVMGFLLGTLILQVGTTMLSV